MLALKWKLLLRGGYVFTIFFSSKYSQWIVVRDIYVSPSFHPLTLTVKLALIFLWRVALVFFSVSMNERRMQYTSAPNNATIKHLMDLFPVCLFYTKKCTLSKWSSDILQVQLSIWGTVGIYSYFDLEFYIGNCFKSFRSINC